MATAKLRCTVALIAANSSREIEPNRSVRSARSSGLLPAALLPTPWSERTNKQAQREAAKKAYRPV